MRDTTLAVQTALHGRLSGAFGSVPIYDHVPDGSQPPAIVIDKIVTSNEGGKGSPLYRHDVDVLLFVRARGRKGLRKMMDEVVERLDDQPLSAAGAVIQRPVHTGSSDEELPDGVTYAGLVRFTIWAQPA
jgi:hypothetical protein